MARAAMRFSKLQCDGCRAFELLQHNLQDTFNIGGCNNNFADRDSRRLTTGADRQGDALKGDAFVISGFEAVVGRRA